MFDDMGVSEQMINIRFCKGGSQKCSGGINWLLAIRNLGQKSLLLLFCCCFSICKTGLGRGT